MTDAAEELRAMYRERFPLRNADSWHPSEGEMMIFQHFSELRRADLKLIAEQNLKLSRHLTDHRYAR